MATTIDLSGKVALVTGASKGIGFGITRRLVEAGASVVLSSRKIEALEEAAESLGAEASTAVFAANAGRPEEAAACVAFALSRFGRLDILVNNAATNPYMGKTIDVDLPRFDKTFEVNVRGPLVWIQEAWKQWMSEHGGSVINISSVGAYHYSSAIGVYDMTKAALIHLTKQLASELGPAVRVNAIAPGLVRTDFARALWERGGDEAGRALPTKRLGEPDDIAGAALFLASDLARWMTGDVIVVDGGALTR